VTVRVGVDVGGTFTDLVLVRDDGTTVLEKTPTTPADQSEGVLAGLARLAGAAGLASARSLLEQTATIVHGTTTGDNTLIEMRGAPTGLLVTEGFRDEIEMRRCFKEDIWDPAYPPPPPIARRRVRLEVRERLTAEGEVDTPLDEDSVRRAARRLRALGVTSVAIVFLHSYVDPTHERRARELLLEEHPDVELVSLSHEVYPRPPEFERTSTTLVNAYVGPPIVRYVGRLVARLRDEGFAGELLLATSAGGVAHPDVVARLAVATIGSGPTGGAVAAARAAAAARDAAHDTARDVDGVVSADMGGTSFDVCLVRGGRPEITSEWNWRHRYCIALPMVDIHSIGAGGGSIARAVGGVLHVGPESAGSDPGPACYGRGGTSATVTDADLVLGRLDPAGFYGGRMPLDETLARAALHAVGEQLGLDADATAVAVSTLVDAHATDAIRRVLALAGADPRRLDLVAFGGMGAVHATAQAAALGSSRVVVPHAAPGLSALGLVTADHVVDRSRALVAPWREVDVERLDELAADLEREAFAELSLAGIGGDRTTLAWSCNLVYPGQTFDTSVPVRARDGRPYGRDDVEAAVEEFHRRNEAARLIEARAQEPLVRGVRLVARGVVDVPPPAAVAARGAPPSRTRRRVHTGDRWHDAVPVHDGAAWGPGHAVEGPAIVELPFTTLVLREGDVARRLAHGDVTVDVAPLAQRGGALPNRT
jgi:N-methylhydantoinase A